MLEALGQFLQVVSRSARLGIPPPIDPKVESKVLEIMPAVVGVSAKVLALQADLRAFDRDLKAATPYVIVTPMVASICVAIFAAMLLSGMPVMEPNPISLLSWGANNGLAVALLGQWWRLATGMFLHIGLIHLAMNMWCLLAIGPLVERLFGNAAFAAVYVLSGLGGSLASIAVHPDTVGAGASGALFGILGALGAFLLAHGRAIPASILKPIRGGVGAFLVYNLLFGAIIPNIDMSAHLGGLAVGFLCGSLLQRPWPHAPTPGANLRRFGLAVAVAVGLGLVGVAVASRIRHDPRWAAIGRAQRQAEDFSHSVGPCLARFTVIGDGLNRALDALGDGSDPSGPVASALDDLASLAGENLHELRRVEARHEAPGKMLTALIQAQENQGKAIDALRRFLDDGDERILIEAGGFNEHQDASNRAIASFVASHREWIGQRPSTGGR